MVIGNNLFAKQSWEEMEKDTVMEDVQHGNLRSNSKISPFLSKMVSPRNDTKRKITATTYLASDGDFKERCLNELHSVLNEHIQSNVGLGRENLKDSSIKDVVVLGNPVELSARYMVDRIADKVAYIEHRISQIEAELEEKNPETFMASLATAVQQPSTFVGRICCDTENGRLNAQSVLLEGSISRSNGARVKVDLSNVEDYRLFPGQVSIIKGTNPSGFCLAATAVESPSPLPQKPSRHAAKEGLSCIIATGPFTVAENINYEPLSVILEYAEKSCPDVLILMGPFVDHNQEIIRNNKIEEEFAEIFDSRILSKLVSFSEQMDHKVRIVLMPSCRDVHHDFVFPQGPFPKIEGLPMSVTTIGNPSTFSYDDVVFGCCAEDWLISATKEETSKASQPPDRLSALASHAILQRNYFPMFPPSGVPLDTSRGYALEMPCTPHILVTSSDLVPFAKVLRTSISNDNGKSIESKSGSVVCINPGRLTKGSNSGTFAHVHVVPEKNDANETNSIDHRCRVEIRKL